MAISRKAERWRQGHYDDQPYLFPPPRKPRSRDDHRAGVCWLRHGSAGESCDGQQPSGIVALAGTPRVSLLQTGEYFGIYFGDARLWLSVTEVNGTESKGSLYIVTHWVSQQYGLNQDIPFTATQEGEGNLTGKIRGSRGEARSPAYKRSAKNRSREVFRRA